VRARVGRLCVVDGRFRWGCQWHGGCGRNLAYAFATFVPVAVLRMCMWEVVTFTNFRETFSFTFYCEYRLVRTPGPKRCNIVSAVSNTIINLPP
jgi:hypothetical protein